MYYSYNDYINILIKDDNVLKKSLVRDEFIATNSNDLSHKFPPFDTSTFISQFFWLLVIFSIFYWIMHRLILPRLDSVITSRLDQVSNDLDQVNVIQEEISGIVNSCDKELSLARMKSKEIIKQVIEDSAKKFDSENKKADKDFLRQLSDAQKNIDKMQDKALKEMSFVAEGVVKDLVHKMIDVSVSDENVQSIVKKWQRKET